MSSVDSGTVGRSGAQPICHAVVGQRPSKYAGELLDVVRILNEQTVATVGYLVLDAAHLAGHHRGRHRRVRVAVDQHAVGLVLEDDRLQAADHLAGHGTVRPAANLQVDVGCRQLEVAEEGGAHRLVVVLAGVHQHLGVVVAQDAADGGGLHELRPRPHDGEDDHAQAPEALADG